MPGSSPGMTGAVHWARLKIASRTPTSIFKQPHRHCEPDTVIPGWSAGPDPESRDSGFDASHRPGMTCLLQFQTHLHDLAAPCARAVEKSVAPKRAWGMPDAQCTRGLVCML